MITIPAIAPRAIARAHDAAARYAAEWGHAVQAGPIAIRTMQASTGAWRAWAIAPGGVSIRA